MLSPALQPTDDRNSPDRHTPDRIITQRQPGTNGELRTRKRYERGIGLGRGSFGRAYLLTALENEAKEPIATKVLLKAKVDLARVAAEVALHRALHHPHIVACFDTFEDDAHLYLLLELCDLTTMQLLKRQGALAIPQANLSYPQLHIHCQR